METTFVGDKRLVLQCDVKNRAQLGSMLAEALPITVDDLHLTVLHIGPAKSLYQEVRNVAGTSLERYELEMVSLLRKCIARSKDEYKAQVTGITVLDSSVQSHLVLLVNPSEELCLLRDYCRRHFMLFLEHCGIKSPELFAAQSRSISQHAPEWLPHITIGAGVRSVPAVKGLGEINLGRLYVRRSHKSQGVC